MNHEIKYLATHNGTFHADDVFAYVVLNKVFPGYELIRSRDPKELEKAEIVFDVGGGQFDHHSTNKEYRENGIPYAAFGLIWRKFGKKLLNEWFPEEHIEYAHQKIEEELVQAVDAFDNGVNIMESPMVAIPTVSDIIADFNHRMPKDGNYIEEYVVFNQACEIANSILMHKLIGIRNLLLAKESVVQAFESRKHPALLELEEGADWGEILEEIDTNEEVLFVTYPKPDGYFIQVMRKESGSFEARKDLPEEWAGKRDNELNTLIGIEDAIFCHPARFLAGAKSKESILKMAELALQA